MFDSKALKDFEPKKRSKLYCWWIESKICDRYYDFLWLFKNPYYQLKKLIEWQINVFKKDHDFDGHSMFAIIEYKLKRIEKCLLNGHAIQETKDLKALKLAIKLAGRLKNDKYEERAYDRIDKKYGEMKTWTEPCKDRSDLLEFKSSRPKVNTEEEKKEEWSFRLEQYRLSEYRKNREEKWMYAILLKYLRVWWD